MKWEAGFLTDRATGTGLYSPLSPHDYLTLVVSPTKADSKLRFRGHNSWRSAVTTDRSRTILEAARRTLPVWHSRSLIGSSRKMYWSFEHYVILRCGKKVRSVHSPETQCVWTGAGCILVLADKVFSCGLPVIFQRTGNGQGHSFEQLSTGCIDLSLRCPLTSGTRCVVVCVNLSFSSFL